MKKRIPTIYERDVRNLAERFFVFSDDDGTKWVCYEAVVEMLAEISRNTVSRLELAECEDVILRLAAQITKGQKPS